MPSNNQTRARVRRSANTEGTEAQQDALGLISDALPEIIESLANKAKNGDVNAGRALLALQQEEFSRARSGANDPMLLRLKEIREAGSPQLERIWATLYKNLPKIEVTSR